MPPVGFCAASIFFRSGFTPGSTNCSAVVIGSAEDALIGKGCFLNSTTHRPPCSPRRLRSRGVRVEEIEAYTLDEVVESFSAVGGFIGREAEAALLVARVRAELAEVGASVEGLPRPSVAVVIAATPFCGSGTLGSSKSKFCTFFVQRSYRASQPLSRN